MSGTVEPDRYVQLLNPKPTDQPAIAWQWPKGMVSGKIRSPKDHLNKRI